MRRHCGELGTATECYFQALLLADELEDRDALKWAAERADAANVGSTEARAATATRLGHALAERGYPGLALTYLDRALRREPTQERLERLTAIAADLGAHAKARRATEFARGRGITSKVADANIERARRQSMR
jgi:tetratricopeptide (TPR) repeat protein